MSPGETVLASMRVSPKGDSKISALSSLEWEEVFRLVAPLGMVTTVLQGPKDIQSRLKRGPIDVILVDGCQEGRADDMVREIRSLSPEAAIVVLLPPGKEQLGPLLLEAGAMSWLVKEPGWVTSLPQVLRTSALCSRELAKARGSEEYLRMVFDSMSSGVIVTDEGGSIIELNASAISYLGLDDGKNMVGQLLNELVPDCLGLLCDSLPGEQRRIDVAMGGERRTFGYSSTRHPTTGHRVTVFRDLTPLLRGEQRRRRAEQLAQVGEMAAKLSHEIKNPLASILSGLQLIQQDRIVASPQRTILEGVIKEVRRLSRIVHELLSAARPAPMCQLPTSLVGEINEIVDLYSLLASSHGVDLEVAHGLSWDVQVMLDPMWFRQAVANLILNAMEATGLGGRIMIETRMVSPEKVQSCLQGLSGEVVGVAVTDDGPGVSQGHVDSLFEPFMTTKSGGTGLGLAVAQDVVEAHGGVLKLVESGPGRTTFEIFLPSLARPSRAGAPCRHRDPSLQEE